MRRSLAVTKAFFSQGNVSKDRTEWPKPGTLFQLHEGCHLMGQHPPSPDSGRNFKRVNPILATTRFSLQSFEAEHAAFLMLAIVFFVSKPSPDRCFSHPACLEECRIWRVVRLDHRSRRGSRNIYFPCAGILSLLNASTSCLPL